MRDPNRIDKVIDAVKEAWKENPEWRLGQLIVNISRAANCSDPFFLEDDRLMGVITAVSEEGEPDALAP